MGAGAASPDGCTTTAPQLCMQAGRFTWEQAARRLSSQRFAVCGGSGLMVGKGWPSWPHLSSVHHLGENCGVDGTLRRVSAAVCVSGSGSAAQGGSGGGWPLLRRKRPPALAVCYDHFRRMSEGCGGSLAALSFRTQHSPLARPLCLACQIQCAFTELSP